MFIYFIIKAYDTCLKLHYLYFFMNVRCWMVQELWHQLGVLAKQIGVIKWQLIRCLLIEGKFPLSPCLTTWLLRFHLLWAKCSFCPTCTFVKAICWYSRIVHPIDHKMVGWVMSQNGVCRKKWFGGFYEKQLRPFWRLLSRLTCFIYKLIIFILPVSQVFLLLNFICIVWSVKSKNTLQYFR